MLFKYDQNQIDYCVFSNFEVAIVYWLFALKQNKIFDFNLKIVVYLTFTK